MPYNTKNYTEQGGEKTVIGGEIDIIGLMKMAGENFNIKVGITEDVTGTEDVDTGLDKVEFAIAMLVDDPDSDANFASVVIKDQSADAGEITLKTWKQDASAVAAAGTDNKKVAWLAIGE